MFAMYDESTQRLAYIIMEYIQIVSSVFKQAIYTHAVQYIQALKTRRVEKDIYVQTIIQQAGQWNGQDLSVNLS